MTLKNRGRLGEIIRETGSTYECVWYLARPTLVPTLQKIAAESAWQKMAVLPGLPSPDDLPL